MPKSLPSRPNLEQLKKQAKDLHKSQQRAEPEALQRIRQYHPRHAARDVTAIARSEFALSDAQLVVAREYGFASWPQLKAHVESILVESEPLEALKTAVVADDTELAARVLARHPELKARLDEPLPGAGFGSTALLAAVGRKSKAMVELLLQAGADINARSHWWAGSFGVLDNDHGLAPFLIERGARVDAHAAARLGLLDKLKELISARPELVHARGGDGQTPLHCARTVEIAEYLLSQGADINARDVDHESTPAQYMVRDRQDVARFLVRRGCETDILMAAALGDVELVRKLLAEHPDCIRMTVSKQWFPKRNPQAGGTIYIWTLGQHKTPHLVAREFGHEQVLRLLLERTPEELKLAQACELGDEALFGELLRQRPDLVRTLTEPERRRLPDAALNNNTQAVELMLRAGWPVDARGQHGATALHWAAFHGNAEMVKTLLQHDAPLECVDRDFDATPLGWAIYGSENGWHCKTGNYTAAVEALLHAGARLPQEVAGTEAVQQVLENFARAGKPAAPGTRQQHQGQK